MIIEYLGKKFMEFPPLDLNLIYEESKYNKPIVFILSAGSDPKKNVELLSKKFLMNKNLIIKSMG
ncbi:MAG: hypothetical protein ACK52J_03945 [bacterium]|jgi:hypothetical protein